MTPPPSGRSHCPLCGQPNACAMEAARLPGSEHPPCWCTQVDFSRELLEQLPVEARGQVCICAACARQGASR